MNTTSTVSIVLGITTLIFIVLFFDINLFEGLTKVIADMGMTITDYIQDHNRKRRIERIKREKIVIEKENIFAKYNRLVEGIIKDMKLPLTLESFTSVVMIGFAVCVLAFMMFMQNITLAVVVTVALLIALLTFFVMQ